MKHPGLPARILHRATRGRGADTAYRGGAMTSGGGTILVSGG